jgi:2-polyprenyl-3-methyl-5-hydroxy-6-metoxy-1,4-benzoquinol methylase
VELLFHEFNRKGSSLSICDLNVRQDADFDEIGNAFEEDIHGPSKGRVRPHVLWNDLVTAIPELRDGALSVLDAGGGAGRIAIRLAREGNRNGSPSRARR